MKQKEIVINPNVSPDAEAIITAYFAAKTVNGIEGFILSEDEFVNKHKDSYAFHEFFSARYHAVYGVIGCNICLKPFDVNINDRQHLYQYAQADYRLCSKCKLRHDGTLKMLGMMLDGNIGL